MFRFQLHGGVLIAAILALAPVAGADGAGLAGGPDAPASLKPWNNGAMPHCGASLEASYPLAGVRVLRGRSSACGRMQTAPQPADEGISLEQTLVFVQRPYRWRSDFATRPQVRGAPPARRY